MQLLRGFGHRSVAGDRLQHLSLTRVHNFSISLDGFGTGEGQSHDAHFGHAGDRLRRNRCVDYDPGR
jgi:hypothetical protein